MRKLVVFNHVTLDGYFTDAAGDMSWAHRPANDPEWNEFVASNAGSGGALVFGRVTYEMMAGFWPTPQAMQMMPVVAERMNNLAKFVFSNSLKQAAWNNTQMVKGDPAAGMRELKNASGPDMVILGSGSLVAHMAQAGLIDEVQMVLNPIALGGGRTMFGGLKQKLPLKLKSTRTFGNGNVLLCYEPAS